MKYRLKNCAESFPLLEARYPAVLFKQQLTACLEKIFGLIRDGVKNEISALLALCIQVNGSQTVFCFFLNFKSMEMNYK